MNKTLTKEGVYDFSKEKKIEKLIIKGDNIKVIGLTMNNITNKGIKIEGNNCILEKCIFINNEKGDNIVISGSNAKIINCLFERFVENSNIIYIKTKKSRPSYNLIYKCNFRDIDNTELNIIKIGDKSDYLSKCIIYNNFFSNCKKNVVLFNSSNNVFIFNKVIECKGLVIKSKNNIIKYNYFYDNYLEDNEGVKILNNKNNIIRNTFEGNINSVLDVKNCKYVNIKYNNILSSKNALSLNNISNLCILDNKIVKCENEIKEKEVELNNSVIKNEIIKKDIKIEVFKAEDVNYDNIQELYVSLYTEENKLNEKKQDKEIKKIDKKENKEDNFDNVLEKLDLVLEEYNNKDECLSCIENNKELEIMKNNYEEKINKLLKEINMYKTFYDNVKNRFS